MKPKFGIIGCGGIARFHFEALKKSGAEVVHIADINEETAKPYAEQFGAKYSKNYLDLIADPSVTVVSVLASGKFHFEMCKAALEAGKDVICEKTMMDNADEAEEIVKIAKRSGRIFFTAYMKGFFPAVKKAKDLLPGLGKLYSANVRVFQPWGNLFEVENNEGFQWTLQNYGGAVTKMAGSHMLNMTMNLLGRPQSLYANIDFMENTKIDRRLTAIFEFESSLAVTFEAVTNPHSKVGYERNGWDEHIQINGVKGRIDIYFVMWDKPENNGLLLSYYDEESKSVKEYRFDAVNPFDLEMKYFCDCLEKRIQGNPDVIDGFNVDNLIAAIMQSANQKARVEIDWRGL